jgi:hypothetical protein
MHVVRFPLLLLILTGALAVGCGQGAFNSPTAPSDVLSSTLPDGGDLSVAIASTADVSSALKGGDKGHGGGKEAEHDDKGKNKEDDSAEDVDEHGPGDHGRGHDGETHGPGTGEHGNHGELSGFVTAKGANSLTVRGITVKIVTATIIRHGHTMLTLADIEVGDHVQARGTRDAAGTTLTATEIKVEDTEGDDEDKDEHKNEVEGTVAALTGTCPAITFTVGTTKVTTSSTTTFKDGVCTGIANGTKVEVKGTLQTDGSIAASSVELD